MPVFTGNKKVDKEEEDRKLAALLKDDFIADGPDSEGDEVAPVRLPLLSSASAAGCTVTDGLKIKYEEDSENADNVHSYMDRKLRISQKKEEVKLAAIRKAAAALDLPVASMFKESTKELIFFQFPDCLPVLTPTDGEDKQKSQKQPSSGGGGGLETRRDKAPSLVSLSDLPEGQLGRLQLLRSGGARLLLGQHVLHLEPGTQVKFLQEAASVSVNEENSRGDVTFLGNLSHRIVCSPAWESIINSR